MAERPMTTIDEVVAAIQALGDEAYTPEDLRRRMVAFRSRHAQAIVEFHCDVRAMFDDLIEGLAADQAEVEVALGALTPEFMVIAACIGVDQPRQAGKPFSPARFACAAYDAAKAVAAADPDASSPATRPQ